MKKRTVKDFIALYAQEDGEKLVLIQSGTSADKTFLDTFWTAHTHALAMADVQTGQVISGRCYLSWPLTDKERESGGYSKRFAKGRIYRIKARGWKGDALSEPQWYVTEILQTIYTLYFTKHVILSGTGGALGGIHKAHSSGGRGAGNPHAGS